MKLGISKQIFWGVTINVCYVLIFIIVFSLGFYSKFKITYFKNEWRLLQFFDFPEGILGLKNLTVLSLNENYLTELPDANGNLKYLRYIQEILFNNFVTFYFFRYCLLILLFYFSCHIMWHFRAHFTLFKGSSEKKGSDLAL